MKILLNYFAKIFILTNIVFISLIRAQVTYEHLDSDIYNFMERCSQKGIIEYNDYVKPLSRIYFADKLEELIKKKNMLTKLELDELNYFVKQFGKELNKKSAKTEQDLTFLGKDKYDIWRPFNFISSNAYINVFPVIGYTKARWDDIDYSKLSVVLLQQVQKQQSMIDALSERITKLEK